MIHGQTVAYGNGRHFHGSAACGADACLDGFGNAIEVHVSRNNFVGGIDHADERSFDFRSGQTQSVQKRTMRSFFQPFRHVVTAHDDIPVWL